MLIFSRGVDRNACPRCGGVVFEAEKAATTPKGNPFHAKVSVTLFLLLRITLVLHKTCFAKNVSETFKTDQHSLQTLETVSLSRYFSTFKKT